MKMIGNILWFFLGGIFMGLSWWELGVLAYLTIIGIPWAKACFVIGQFSFFPFGKEAVARNELSHELDVGTGVWGLVGNVIWFLFGGFWLAVGHLSSALLCFISIIFMLLNLKPLFTNLGWASLIAMGLSACQPDAPKSAQTTASEANPTSATQDLLDVVKTRGVLKVGLEGTYPPFNFKGKDQKLEGFEVELADEIGKRMGVKVEFTQGEWGGLLASVQTGKIDILVNQVGINDKRKETFDFSLPYTYSSAQLIVKTGNESKFKNLEEMKGATLAVTQGSNFSGMVQAYPDIKVRLYPGMNDYLQDVSLGRVDGALNDSLVILTSIKKSGLPLSGGAIIGTTLSLGIPFNKGNPKFKATIDKTLTDMFNDGSFAGISKKWLGVDVSKQPGQQ